MRLIVDFEGISRQSKHSSSSHQGKDSEGLSSELEDVDKTDLGVQDVRLMVEVGGRNFGLEFRRLHYEGKEDKRPALCEEVKVYS